MIIKTLKTLARRCGIDIARYQPDMHHEARFGQLVKVKRIRLFLDVGANTGQYGSLLRSTHGYRGEILSFEPLADAHAALTARAAADPFRLWRTAPRMALGATSCTKSIYVAGNSVSSSLLPMDSLHEAALPASRCHTVEEVPVNTLDNAVKELGVDVDASVWLKIDTQGYELEVLRGSSTVIGAVGVIQVEMSFQELYAGQPLFHDLYCFLMDHGFTVFDMVPGFCDTRSGRLLQVDGIFSRQ